MHYYLHRKYRIGVEGDLEEALTADYPGDPLKPYDFEEVTADEYENTVLDLRFEDGEWQQ